MTNVLKFDYHSFSEVIQKEMSRQSIENGGDVAKPIKFNGSNMSAITEQYLASVMRGKDIGCAQANYDVLLDENSRLHWAKKLEQRNMVKSSNLGPSTTAGKNRYFDKDKFIEKMNDCDSLIIFDLNSNPRDIDIYEIPTKLIAGLWKINVIGTEVVIDKKKQGYRNAMISYTRFTKLFPIQDYRFVLNPNGHKMKDETAKECWEKAQNKKYGKIKACMVEFDFDLVDFERISNDN
jgi:hypothetical protein